MYTSNKPNGSNSLMFILRTFIICTAEYNVYCTNSDFISITNSDKVVHKLKNNLNAYIIVHEVFN